MRDLDEEIDIRSLTGVDLLCHMFHYFENKGSSKDSRTNPMLGNANKTYFTEFKVDGNDIILDSGKIETHDFDRGRDGTPLSWLVPGFAINKKLALSIGWFQEKASSNPQAAIKPGPNLVIEPRGYLKPNSMDIRTRWNGIGTPTNSLYIGTCWLIPRMDAGALSGYIHLSLDVNWRFTNLNYAFSHMFAKTM